MTYLYVIFHKYASVPNLVCASVHRSIFKNRRKQLAKMIPTKTILYLKLKMIQQFFKKKPLDKPVFKSQVFFETLAIRAKK